MKFYLFKLIIKINSYFTGSVFVERLRNAVLGKYEYCLLLKNTSSSRVYLIALRERMVGVCPHEILTIHNH